DDGELQFPAQREDGGEQASHALLVRRRPRVPARGAVRVRRLPWWGRLRASPTVVPRHDHPPLSGPGARRSVSAAHLIVTRVPASRTQEPPGSRRPPAGTCGPPGGRAGDGPGRGRPEVAACDGWADNGRYVPEYPEFRRRVRSADRDGQGAGHQAAHHRVAADRGRGRASWRERV